jgi:hypothetical protein
MSGGSSQSYDAAYNARIAKLMEEEAARAGERYDWEKQYIRPIEEAMATANLETLPTQTEIQKTRLQYQADALPEIYGALGQRDVGEEMGRATADVATAFDAREKERQMTMRGLGVTPRSSTFQATGTGIGKALGVAGARTAARRTTEDENLRQRIAGLSL